MIIIPATEAHMPEITAIEQESFTSPWAPGLILYELNNPDTYFDVAVENNAVIGFCILRRIAEIEGDLLNIAVSPSVRGRGVADALLTSALAHAVGIEEIYLEVRVSNSAAISLYEKHGFRHLGRRKHYYDNPIEDAFTMCRVSRLR
ncbi:MAG: ribosomal protein S18-alanine N-acetyltransferase [Oscillospiraceae bacterium]|nr:ribosomal protein S18-alanine N-acetyltransferase [Oscillospiraceae bacterium]